MAKKILVALDGSKNSFRALSIAIDLAKQINSSITGIFVVQSFPTEMGLMETISGRAKSKHFKRFMGTAKSMCTKKNVKFYEVTKHGEEGKIIVSFAQKNNFDMVVLGSRGMGKLGELFLGSTSNFVIHSSKIPVLIVK